MNDWDFTFEQTPWEATLETLRPGDSLSAARFLALLEGEEEAAVEDAFQDLEDKHIQLDVRDLPKDGGSGAAAVRLRQEEQLVRQGRLTEGLEENDPLRLYLEEMQSLPVVNDPETLAARCAAGDQAAMTALTDGYLHRVVEMAQELTSRGVLLLDLIQEGSLGLWQSILHYQGGDFKTHSEWWIRQALAKTVTMQARANGVGQKLRQAVEDYRAADQRLLTELGRNPTLEEIALELHISPEDAAVLEKMLQTARTVQKAKDAQQPKQDDPEDEQAVEDTAYFRSRQRILEMLSGLDEQDAKLLSLRFGLEGGLPLSPEETGRKLGLTPQEVVAREAAALAKLRQDS